MRPSDDDFLLSPDVRLRELAGILATGILRLFSRPAAAPADAEVPVPDSEDSGSARLEVPDKTVLSVHTG
jgi:hypothetical protein